MGCGGGEGLASWSARLSSTKRTDRNEEVLANLLPSARAVPRVVVDVGRVLHEAFVGAVSGRVLVANLHCVANPVKHIQLKVSTENSRARRRRRERSVVAGSVLEAMARGGTDPRFGRGGAPRVYQGFRVFRTD